jgi:hypothetical protein
MGKHFFSCLIRLRIVLFHARDDITSGVFFSLVYNICNPQALSEIVIMIYLELIIYAELPLLESELLFI